MSHPIPAGIRADIGPLLDSLTEMGFTPVACAEASGFGDYFIDLDGPRTMRIVRDRSQYRLDIVARPELEQAGLWRAFDSREEFAEAVLRWVRSFVT